MKKRNFWIPALTFLIMAVFVLASCKAGKCDCPHW